MSPNGFRADLTHPPRYVGRMSLVFFNIFDGSQVKKFRKYFLHDLTLSDRLNLYSYIFNVSL